MKGSTMDESEVRELVESRTREALEHLGVEESWETPAGKQRSVPIYEVEVQNEYLNKQRTVKAYDEDEAEGKARQVLETWAKQEIRKRIVDGKRDTKERAQAEAQRLDQEAKEALADAEGLLATTLAVDDRIEWEAEHDTRRFKRFSFSQPPQQPAPTEPVLPPKPGLAWLLRGRVRQWEATCEKKLRLHQEAEEKAQQDWQEAVRQHEQAREEARQQHESDKAKFFADQEASNKALAEFRRTFEAGEGMSY